MDVRTKHIGINLLLLPVLFYFVWLYLGEFESGLTSVFSVFSSCVVGIVFAVLYGEFIAEKIRKAYFLVTLVIGLGLMVILYALKLDEFDLVNPMSFNLAFFFVAYSYKEEVLAKLSS